MFQRFSTATRKKPSPYTFNPGSSRSCSAPSRSSVQKNRSPDSLATYYLSSCTPADANELHLQILKSGFANEVVLNNMLINIYVRTGNMGFASKSFDEMPERNSVTWASMICGFAKNGMPTESCLHFKRMLGAGESPNHYAFGGVLRACHDSGPSKLDLGVQIHAIISKNWHDCDMVVGNSLVSMYGNCSSSASEARRVFHEMRERNSISWNSLISAYSKRGLLDLAFELFSSMQRMSLNPNEYAFGSVITAASSSPNTSRRLLEQILAAVKKHGFLQNLYVGSALISGFSKFGLIDYALDLFEHMGVVNSVSVNGLMVGLVRQRKGEEAARVFANAKHLVGTNLDSYVVLLSSFAEFSDLEKAKQRGKEVHGYVLRTGWIAMKVAIGNGLINMYSKCGAINDAVSVFKHMTYKDVVSWNAMISSLDHGGCFEEAAMSFSEMRRFGLTPANFTLISTLSSCASLRWSFLGWQIHSEALKLGLDLDTSVSNALLFMYSETGRMSECRKIFSVMPEHDGVSWNSIIGSLSSCEDLVPEAVECFTGMMQSGWKPNRVTLVHILGAASHLSNSKLSRQIHALASKRPFEDDGVIENALIACYGKSGDMDNCEKIFLELTDRKDEVSWNSMISGYIHNGDLPKAIELVRIMMRRGGRRIDSFTFATVLSACASVSTLQHGLEVHGSSIRARLDADIVVGSALVDMYAKCGRIDYASRFFESMPSRNRYSWNSMISGFARHGDGEKALDLFRQMKEQNHSPDHVTFVGVLSACSHVGLVEEGLAHFESMSKVYGLAPKIEQYSCVVDLLGRAGKLDRIESFIDEMPVEPNALIWRTALGACCRSSGRKTELGERAAGKLFEMEPRNAANYVLLANMFARGGKWDEVARARREMRKAEVKKEAGCSWVAMKDGVHVFVSGDKYHPENDLIHEKLKELNEKMRSFGYSPQTEFAMFDLDPESREEVLSYHSEKLALAFVLTRQSNLPIRIMKNLRVCGDCHTAFKYISKIAGRKIILRDTNRFHHFDDGHCSCTDYW